MAYFEWKNDIEGGTPLNAENLNKMQMMILVPTATILPFASQKIPEHFLLCDGREVSRTEYPELFEAIGENYGDGDGSTTFNLPNLVGRMPIGYSRDEVEFNTLGKKGGEKEHILNINEMPQHNHTFNIQGDMQSSTQVLQLDNWNWRNTYQSTGSLVNDNGGSQPHNILNPYQVVNFIIKVD